MVPTFHKVNHFLRLGPKNPGSENAGAIQIARLQIGSARFADLLFRRQTVCDGAKLAPRIPRQARGLAAPQILDENEQIEVLEIIENATDGRINGGWS